MSERTKRLIDGHARKQIANKDGKVPVLMQAGADGEERVALRPLLPLSVPLIFHGLFNEIRVAGPAAAGEGSHGVQTTDTEDPAQPDRR